ncbi:tetratricopeptide repeat protein [Spongiimicrobium salis]|uniref:tetratricopeptide repeat protein n=1 Tax=Spongiimicrobium salis TaxID=1667022 RepID=UPI00374DB71B
MESPNLQRGVQLFDLGRYQEAIPFLQKGIAEEPDYWVGRFYLAVCHFNTEKYDEALEITNALLSENPNEPAIFSLKAKIAFQKERFKEALQHINTAIGLNPFEADHFAVKSSILLQQKKFEEALEMANKGLELDAKDSYCLNLRAQALTKLKRIDQANETVENILYDNPEDAYSHSNVGWVALESGNTQKALDHFRQALFLNPNFEAARQGMSKALKSKNFIYRWYLKYAFWMSNQSSKNQWAFIIGIYVAYRILIKVLDASGLFYLAIPLIIAYLLFALGGWIMEPMSNTILNFDRYGKFLLGKDERLSGYAFGILLFLGLFSGALFYLTNNDYALLFAITFICTLIPLPRAFLEYSKKAKWFGLGYGSLMLAIGLLGALFTNDFLLLETIILIMLIAFTWIGGLIK